MENPAVMNDVANATSRRALGSIQEFGLSPENQAINVTSRDQSQGACGWHACSLYPHSCPVFSGGEMECAVGKSVESTGRKRLNAGTEKVRTHHGTACIFIAKGYEG